MPDYVYLLENRLSADQQNALRHLREAAREAGMILFLTGDAVRDLTSGYTVRELEVAVHGDALKLKPLLEKMGGAVWGEDEASRSLFLCFPGTVRLDVISTHRVEYPKPGQPVYHFSNIQEDLRRRDFTVNAMAISLNEGSYGLLMDPLNGAADIEARTLRLVSNYGFLEEPSLLIRATRFRARLGWEMDPKTATRYENAKGEGVIEHLAPLARSRELEQIGHEADALRILRALETEGWMKVLFPAWSAAKADEAKLAALHDLSVELLLQGVHADMSAAQMQLLTAKMTAKDVAALKKTLLRPGFVEEWNSLEQLAAGFAKVLLAKENQIPSASYRLFTSYDPEAVLWLGFTSTDKAVKERFNLFLKTWPERRQQLPHAVLQEMRITPELATYDEIVRNLFLELIDGRLATVEELKAWLEPFSPPAPPREPVKRTRAKREAKMRERTIDDEDEIDEDSDEGGEDDSDSPVADDEEELDLKIELPEEDLEDLDDDEDEEDDEDEDEKPLVPQKGKAEKPGAKEKAVKPVKAAAKPVVKSAPVKAVKAVAKAANKVVAKTGAGTPKAAPKAAKASKAASGSAAKHASKPSKKR